MMKPMLHRGISLLLCAMLLLQMVPAVSVHVHAEEEVVFSKVREKTEPIALVENTTYLLVVTAKDDTGAEGQYTMNLGKSVAQNFAEYYDEIESRFTVSSDLAKTAAITYGPVDDTGERIGFTTADGSMLRVDSTGIRLVDPADDTYTAQVYWQSGGGDMGVVCFQIDGATYFLNAVVVSGTENPVRFEANTQQGENYRLYMICNHRDVTHYDETKSCANGGRLEYWGCNDCGDIFLDAEYTTPCTVEDLTIAPGHTAADNAVWTYVDENNHATTCTECGEQMLEQHRAVCVDNEDGTHSMSCSICGAQDVIASHQWGDWSYNANMSLHVRTCQLCFAEETSPLHVWGNAKTLESANCVNTGIASTSCTADGCQATKEWETAALGHDLTPWYTVNEVSETRHGKEIRYCLVCGESETRITPMEGHVHNLTYVEADEYYGTIGYYYCSEQTPTEATAGCGGKYLDKAGTQQVTDFDLRIKPCEHDWGDGWREIAATAEASGCWERVCTLCGEIEQVAFPATGHVHEMYLVEATEPSCFLPGNEEHYVCAAEPLYDDSGMQIGYQGYWDAEGTEPVGTGDAQIPTVAHPDFKWVVQDEYDHERECAICGYVQSGSHFYSGYADNGVDADTCQRICLACGYVEKPSQMEGHEISSYTDCGDGEHHQSTCSFCKTTFTMPHNWGVDWTGDVANHRCVEYGCNYSIGEEHIWVLSEDGYTAPSCSAPGSQVYTCICGKTTSETIPEEEHVDEDGDFYCDVCEANLCGDNHPDADNDYYCDQCKMNLCGDNHPDTNNDYYCDQCKVNLCFDKHVDEDTDYYCDYCNTNLCFDEHPDENNNYYCDRCNTNLCFDQHEAEVVPGKEASCTETGLTEGSVCKNCGQILVAQEVIPMTDHPDTDGDYYCDVCKVNLCFDKHEAVAVPGKEASCTETGLTEGSICKNCGLELEAQEVIPMADHQTEVIPAVPSTCTKAGTTEGVKCSACDAVLVEPQPAELAEHIPEAIPAVPATCAKAGLTEGEKCATCGITLKEQQETERLPHTIQLIEAKAPTCTENGKTAGEWCTVCGLVMVVSTELPATGHRWSEWYVSKEATHTQNGYWLRCCLEDCGAFDESPYPGRGHEHPQLKWVEEIPATCNQQGRKGYWYCMDVTTNSQEADEADFAQGCEAMFLDAEGTQLVTVEDLIIPATGEHQMGDWKASAGNNDDSEFIKEERSCTCGYIEYRSTPRETHVHNLIYLEASEPSCLVNGAKARYACTGCPCLFEDAEGQVRMEESDQVIPATGHDYGNWIATDSGHQRQCSLCEELQIKEGHSESPAPGDITGETCSLMCMICRNQAVMDDHLYSEISACSDRWQHQQTCSRCAFALVEDHEFGPWQYGKFTNENTGDWVTGHYRTCECGAMETSVEHLWDKGEEQKPGFMTYRCTVEGCEAEKVDFLRCMHTCADCGNCTAETPCPGKEPCDCTQPEPLQLTEPTFLTNDTEDPNQTYLGDILVKDQDEALDPNAKPGQEIPEAYAGFTVGIQEVPISDEETGEIISNPYTDYVEQALTGYATKHLFDIHLLDEQGQVAESTGDAQYLIRLCLEEETVLALQKGLLRLAHITERGTFFYGVDKDCTPFYKLEGTQAWFWADKFSPFALVEPEAPYFGREALATLANKDALLYAYDQIVMGVETCQDKITIYPVWQAPSLTIAELQMVMDAYTRDHTEHFWLKTKYSISYKKSSGLASAVKPQYSMTGDELAEARARFDAEVEEVLHGITPEMSEFDRQLLVHDRLAARVTYEGSSDYAHDAYGALVEGKAVCQGYAEAFQYLLRRVDIQSFIVTGVGINDEGEIPHAWNLVRIDNKYYHTDLTWDDAGDHPYHAYFNMDDHFITEDHVIAITAYPMEECVELEANYFTVKQTDLNDSQAGNTGVVADKLSGAVNGVSFLLTEKTSPATFLNWFIANEDEIFTKAGLLNVQAKKPAYTYNGREAMISFVAENGEPPHICGNGAVVSGQTAICTTPGWKDYYACSCGKLFTEQACTHEITNLAAWKLGDGKTTAGHSYGSRQDGQPAIHTSSQLQDGMASYYQCAHCGEYFTEDFLPTTWNSLILKAAHQYGDWVADESGHRRSCTCDTCDLTEDNAPHVYLDDYDVDCATCGYERTVVLPEIAVIRPSINTETGKMTVTLIGENPLSGKMMVAVYDLNGRMLGISYADKTLNVDKTGKTFTIVFDKSGTPRLVKAFIFDSSFVPTMVIDSIDLEP